MKFLEEPPPGLAPDSQMTPEQLNTAALFVDQLIELGPWPIAFPFSWYPRL
jgi:hypothetical protein